MRALFVSALVSFATLALGADAHADATARTAPEARQALVAALAGGSARARDASRELIAAPDAAVDALDHGIDALDEAGRALAFDVLFAASCEKSAPVLARFVASSVRREAARARDRLRRCGRAAVPALSRVVASADPPGRVAAAEELGLVAPDAAVRAIVPVLASLDAATRKALRAVLATASSRERAAAALRDALADASLPAETTLDVLRSAATTDDESRRAEAAALARLAARSGDDARLRYLLVAPAARLARAGDADAARLLATFARDAAHPWVRARVADEAGDLAATSEATMAALADAEPRVREAAFGALARAGSLAQPAVTAAIGALGRDEWPFVRARAADALGPAASARDAGDALAAALADRSVEVRLHALDALARDAGRAHAAEVRARLDDAREATKVRVRAADAIGRSCDFGALDLVTTWALRASSKGAGDASRELALGALAALGRLAPVDLDARLAPLMAVADDAALREATAAARATRPNCREPARAPEGPAPEGRGAPAPEASRLSWYEGP